MREQFHIWQSAITKNQIDKIFNEVDKNHLIDATTFSSHKSIQIKRKSKIYWIKENWIKELIWRYVFEANETSFHVNLDNKSEIQYIEYRSDEDGRYDWHQDVNWNGQEGVDRKISVTIQLSDENEYEGGNFEFEDIKSSMNFRAQGTIIIFPSYLRHRVTKVSSGKRCSLVAWFYGPNWK